MFCSALPLLLCPVPMPSQAEQCISIRHCYQGKIHMWVCISYPLVHLSTYQYTNIAASACSSSQTNCEYHQQLMRQQSIQNVSLCCLGLTGLISAAPGRRNSIMQNSAKQVEGMVRMKMEQREYIILCLEDTNDWSNATTRRLVMQVCP